MICARKILLWSFVPSWLALSELFPSHPQLLPKKRCRDKEATLLDNYYEVQSYNTNTFNVITPFVHVLATLTLDCVSVCVCVSPSSPFGQLQQI